MIHSIHQVNAARSLIASLASAPSPETAAELLDVLECAGFSKLHAASSFRIARDRPWEADLPHGLAAHERRGLIAIHAALPDYLATEGKRYAAELVAACRVFLDAPLDDGPAYRIGRRKYQVAGKPILLTASEDDVLGGLIKLGGAAGTRQLFDQTGKGAPGRSLKRIREKYPDLAPFIILPGKRDAGGYRTTITADSMKDDPAARAARGAC